MGYLILWKAASSPAVMSEGEREAFASESLGLSDGFRPKRGCTVGTLSLQSVSLQAETRHHRNVKGLLSSIQLLGF